jgi:PAS domain S-box-containing protein
MEQGREVSIAQMGLTSPAAVRAFLDAAPDGIVVVGPDGRVVMANAAMAQMFGWDPDTLVGEPADRLLADRHRGSDVFRKARAADASAASGTLQGRRTDGEEFPIEISLGSLRSDQGRLRIAIIRDITARGHAEARFRGLLESAPDGMIVVDGDGQIVIVNSQTERIFGYDREELIGQEIEVLVPDRYREIHVRHRHGYFRMPKTRPMGGASSSLTGRRRDGTEFPVEISLSPMQIEEGLWVTAAIRDISDRKMVENKLRESLKEKEVLLKEVHHRVKNNLQIVSSMLNLQLDRLTDRQAVASFMESQNRVRSIALFHEKLYQSRDLARIDVGEYLRGVVTGLFATYGADPGNVSLRVEAEDVPLDVDGAISCGLIVNELVSNALKYAFPDGRRGEVRVGLRREGSDVVLEVVDDGTGLPADLDLDDPGTLGLKLVSILAEQVRGTIEVRRSPGTRFLIHFPGERP